MSECGVQVVDYNGKVLSKDDIDQCLKELKNLVLGDEHLKNFRNDDSYLMRFLHCTNFNFNMAYLRMKEYYNHLQENPEWFASTSPLDKKQEILRAHKGMLQERDKAGRRVFVMKMGKVDPTNSSPQEQNQLDEMWFEFVNEDPKTQATGISIIMDIKGYSFKMFKWVTPSNIRINSKKVDLYPCKEVVYHIVNTSFLVNVAVKIIWPLLSSQLKNKIKFHFTDWSSLHEYISPEILPPEYGGTGPEIDYDKMCESLFNQSSEIEKRLKYQKVV